MATRSRGPNLAGPLPSPSRNRKGKGRSDRTGRTSPEPPIQTDRASSSSPSERHGDRRTPSIVGGYPYTPRNRSESERSTPGDTSLNERGTDPPPSPRPRGNQEGLRRSEGPERYDRNPFHATQAQESQKILQKIIPNKEIEAYVDQWNPWVIKQALFPPTEPRNKGKKKSSTYQKMKYDDGARWAEVADILQAARAMYKHTKPSK